MTTACLLLGSAIAEAQTNQIQSTGNVGIGTTSPSGVLEVKKDIGATVIGAGTYGNVIGSNHDGYELNLVGGIPDAIGTSYANGNMGGQIRLGGSARGDGDVNVVQFLQNGVEKARLHNNGNFGIGTTNPTAKLYVNSGENVVASVLGTLPEGPAELRVRAVASQPGWGRSFSLVHSFYNDERNGAIHFHRGGSTDGGFLSFSTNGLERFRVNTEGNLGIGTTNPTHKLSVNGTIRAKEIIVETSGWSDYVFEPSYPLMSLAETEQHIKEKGHLPGIPSSGEVERDGIPLGAMQATLLAKFEEMTLHMIEMNKEVERLRARVAELEAKP